VLRHIGVDEARIRKVWSANESRAPRDSEELWRLLFALGNCEIGARFKRCGIHLAYKVTDYPLKAKWSPAFYSIWFSLTERNFQYLRKSCKNDFTLREQG